MLSQTLSNMQDLQMESQLIGVHEDDLFVVGMSGTSRDLDASAENSAVGPDYFGFFAREIADLLSQEENFMDSFPESSDLAGKLAGVARENILIKSNSTTTGSAPLFVDAIGSQLSDFKKERLKSLLRQCLFTFNQEVEGVLTPILNICRARSLLRYKESRVSLPDAANGASEEHNPQPLKKQKLSASCAIDDDLQLLLENDNTKLDEIMTKHSDQLLETIGHMEQKLEEFLDLVMSNCRLMTLTEKQQLRKLIQNLPSRNLERVVEIIRRSRPSATYSCDEIPVDLEEESKVTLWRLYYYVEAVASARKLCEVR
ncbi:hypothetical protein ACH5RR_011017 [Cinchona calisaya]|uniref:NET domain-containing protein n=1 Tax=Cinchona calisaya TaxID=153742 RepID=A0ABD3A648_9GENT